jgi:hypothetical protein
MKNTPPPISKIVFNPKRLIIDSQVDQNIKIATYFDQDLTKEEMFKNAIKFFKGAHLSFNIKNVINQSQRMYPYYDFNESEYIRNIRIVRDLIEHDSQIICIAKNTKRKRYNSDFEQINMNMFNIQFPSETSLSSSVPVPSIINSKKK